MPVMEKGCVAVAMVQRKVTVVHSACPFCISSNRSSLTQHRRTSIPLAQTRRRLVRRAHVHAARQPRLPPLHRAGGTHLVLGHPQHLPHGRQDRRLGRRARAPAQGLLRVRRAQLAHAGEVRAALQHDGAVGKGSEAARNVTWSGPHIDMPVALVCFDTHLASDDTLLAL